jgi:hypothetical protein
MKSKKTIKQVVIFETEEIKEAIIFWLTRSPKNNAQTCQTASSMHNSECKFSMPKNKPLTVSFEWDEDQETI